MSPISKYYFFFIYPAKDTKTQEDELLEEKGNEEPIAKTFGDENAPAKRNGKFKEPILHCMSKTS